jgi:hypothetical protein
MVELKLRTRKEGRKGGEEEGSRWGSCSKRGIVSARRSGKLEVDSSVLSVLLSQSPTQSVVVGGQEGQLIGD